MVLVSRSLIVEPVSLYPLILLVSGITLLVITMEVFHFHRLPMVASQHMGVAVSLAEEELKPGLVPIHPPLFVVPHVQDQLLRLVIPNLVQIPPFGPPVLGIVHQLLSFPVPQENLCI